MGGAVASLHIPQQALQDLRTASKAIRFRLIGFVAPSVARVRISRQDMPLPKTSAQLPEQSGRRPSEHLSTRRKDQLVARSASQRPWRYSKKTLLTKMKKIGGRRRAATLTKTITTSSKTGGPDPLNAFHSFGKLR